MASINFGDLSVQTPVPYDKNEPDANREKLAYTLLQMLQLFKDSGAVLDLPFSVNVSTPEIAVNLDLSELTQAVKDLQFEQLTFDLGPLHFTIWGRSVSVGLL